MKNSPPSDSPKPFAPKEVGACPDKSGKAIEAAVEQGRPFESQRSPSEASCAALWGALRAARSVKGKSKAALESKRLRERAAVGMLEARWAGPGLSPSSVESLWDALIGAKSSELVEAALEAGLPPWRATGAWRHTPVGLAIYHGRMGDALLMAEAMPEASVAQAAKGGDALLFDLLDNWDKASSASGGLWAIWKGKGLDVDARNYGRENGQTPLMAACRTASWRLSAVEAFLAFGANPNLVDEEGRSAMHHLCGQPHGADGPEALRAAKALLRAGADPLAEDAHGASPLDLAKAARWWEGAAMLAAFEAREGLSGKLADEAKALGLAVMELRRRGYGLVDPGGSPVEWGQAAAAAEASAAAGAKKNIRL